MSFTKTINIEYFFSKMKEGKPEEKKKFRESQGPVRGRNQQTCIVNGQRLNILGLRTINVLIVVIH